MSLTKPKLEQLFELLEDVDIKQSYSILLRLKEVPPENTDTLKEALYCFNALDELEVYKFLQQIKHQYSQEDWDILVGDQ
jgi:hypothetical protein